MPARGRKPNQTYAVVCRCERNGALQACAMRSIVTGLQQGRGYPCHGDTLAGRTFTETVAFITGNAGIALPRVAPKRRIKETSGV